MGKMKMTMTRRSPVPWLLGALWVWSGVCFGADDPSLIGWWQLNEAAGTVAADSSGNGNDATLAGSAAFTSGLYAGGVYCDGTEAYVAVPNVLTTTCTLAFWFKPDWDGSSSPDYRLFDAGAGDKYFFVSKGAVHDTMTAAYFGFFFEDATDFDFQNVRITAAGNIAAGTWYHVAATWQFGGGNAVLYLNGTEISRATSLGAFPTLATNPRFGYTTGASGGVTATNGAAAVFDDIKVFNRVLTPEEIPGLMAGTGLGQASAPSPADEATDVSRDAALNWRPGIYAASHDIYLGTSAEDVANATRAEPLGMLAEQALDDSTYDPSGRFEFGQTYYWRVDEVNAAPGSEIFAGSVWSFTVEPVSYPIESVTATASSQNNANMGQEKAVDGSGLTDDTHSITANDMWLSAKTGPQPTWIQFAFDKVYKLDKVRVWNSNQPMEAEFGLGARNVILERSTDDATWVSLGEVEIPQAPGESGYTGSVVNLSDAVAKYVKFTIQSNWGGFFPQYGLSEVRFYQIPVRAREPEPAAAATGVTPPITLSWRAGREAASHEVYLGTDPNTLTALGTVTATSFAAADLSLETQYYWRIDEVNTAETPSAWAGDVWTFTTSDFRVVDDMESYSDDEAAGQTIYQAWQDGYGTTTNGAWVGYEESANGTFGETAIVHGGKQSMPLRYGQNSATTSEATRTFNMSEDWTLADVRTLVLHFHGAATNDAAQLYLKINGTKIDYGGSSASVAIALWKQWNIDLASVSGVDFRAVKTMTIGISGVGQGILYIDDIRLYKTAPAVITPIDPGTADLVSHIDMENAKVSDSVSGVAGTPSDVAFDASMTGLGQAAQFNGTSSYVDLGADYWTKVVSKLSSCTFAVWVNYSATGGAWQRVFDLGCGTNVNVFLTTGAGTVGVARFAVKTDVPNSASTNAGFFETGVNASSTLIAGWHHLVGIVDATGGAAGNPVLYLYIDGVLVGGPSAGRLPKDMALQTGTPWQMWLGRSQYTADPYFNGAIDELRVFNRALSEGEVRYLAGDR